MFSFEIRSSITRLLIYGLAFVIMAGSLLYSNYLAGKLSEREGKAAELYGMATNIVGNVNPESPKAGNELMDFIMSNLLIENYSRVPIIVEYTDPHLYETANIEGLDPSDTIRIKEKIQSFLQAHDTIKIEYVPNKFNYLYFGDTFLIRQLRWFPFIQLLVAFVFIGVVFGSFAIAKRNEQNKVWVGLARETAHQLGTPVSSLMAWIELLRMKAESRPEDGQLIEDMANDVQRLEIIAERFSKIGSQPELVEEDLKKILDRSADYLKKRMTQRGSIKLEVNNEVPQDSQLQINPQLFDWVIENLLKNALDAIQSKSKEGLISINAGEKGNQYFIDVSDTGKGIAKSHFKKVFEPGFTTKKRGWGLGLSLTKRIVEEYHNGKIIVKQSELNKGTTFRVLMPKHQ